jgi:hypothetical protein
METIDQIRRRSRKALHDFMGRPAAYYANPEVRATATYEVIKARPHSKTAMAGDLAGTNLSYAQTRDRAETVVFWREEVKNPTRLSLVIFSEDEAYFVHNVMPPDGQTITAEVVFAERSEIVGYQTPSGEVIEPDGD